MLITIERMRIGEEGVVASIEGGREMKERVTHLGIRAGKKIRKTAGHARGGPQTISVGHHSSVALGHGMASKIMIEIKDK